MEEEEEVGARDEEGRKQVDGSVVEEVEGKGRKEQERERAPSRAAANGKR